MSTEQQLADLFAEQARQAPPPEALLDGALRKVRSRRRRMAAGVAAAAAVVCVSALWPGLHGGQASNQASNRASNQASNQAGHTSTPMDSVPAGMAGQALPDVGGSQSCAYEYSPDLVAARLDFALDGTVVAVGPPVSNRPGDPAPWDYAGVTLRVNEWFKGGTASKITVDMPATGTSSEDHEGSPAGYGIGTRMLVSGTARWGGTDPLAYPVAWWGCGGFTRYYSPSLADQWRAAMR